jgi:hypothetical protein
LIGSLRQGCRQADQRSGTVGTGQWRIGTKIQAYIPAKNHKHHEGLFTTPKQDFASSFEEPFSVLLKSVL